MGIEHHQRAIRLILILLIGLLIWPGSARVNAQDNTPDTGDIYSYRAEIIFPAAVRFFVGLNVPPEQVRSATLTIRQESGLRLTFTLDPAQYIVQTDKATFVDLGYTWALNTDPTPVPFESLNFLWEVETQDGQVSSAADEVLFEDTSRGDWQTTGEPPFILHWYNEGLAGGTIRNEVMAAYGQLSRNTGSNPLYDIALYDPNTTLCETVKSEETGETRSVVFSMEDASEYPCSVDDFVRLYANAGITFLQRPTLGYAELQDFLVNHMVSSTYSDLWQDIPVPAWYSTGLPFLYHLRPAYTTLQTTRSAGRTESLFSLSQMSVPVPDDATFQEDILWDAQSYLMVLYIAERYGAQAPFDLAMDIPAQGSFEAALQALSGETLAEFWDNWNLWLFSEAAERALTWTPYLPTTPTPTATSTHTPIPPTYTPSHTPTITLTPTSSFLGDQPRTVVKIEITASPTQVRSATNTPLPPGSLPSVTPLPTPGPAAETEGEEMDPIVMGSIAVLVGGLVLLILALVFSMFKRRN